MVTTLLKSVISSIVLGVSTVSASMRINTLVHADLVSGHAAASKQLAVSTALYLDVDRLDLLERAQSSVMN